LKEDIPVHKVTKLEFRGSGLLVLFLMITTIGIPWAIIHLINNTVAIEFQVDDPWRA
jgi:hypothetical protein